MKPGYLIVGMIVAGFAGFRLIDWVRRPLVRPDPWGEEIDEALQRADAVPVCHHCLAEQPEGVHFCPECGTATGVCTNLLPFDYVFTLGETLRIGSSGRFRITPVTVAGFLLLSLAEYAIFAPLYWYFLVQNIFRLQDQPVAPPPVGPPLAAE